MHYVGAETCAACHAAEYEEWKGSKHAGAVSPTFLLQWERNGRSPQCLSCHTTAFNQAHGTFESQGVSCESCHGPYMPGHPQGGTMGLPVDSTACMSCHTRTYREWQLSGHAKHNIRCFDCHEVHRQGLRQPNVESQCGACHPQRLEDFAHATHHFQGLTCATCHMPSVDATDTIGGTGAPAHSFFVGAQTCAACHEEMVHKSHKIPSLTQEVEHLAHTTDAQTAERLQARIRQLELETDLQKSRTVKIGLIAALVGLLLGAFAVTVSTRRKNGRLP